MFFLIVFKKSCKKYEGAKALTQTCKQHFRFDKVPIKVYSTTYFSIAAGLKSCFYSEHEFYRRYFTMIFTNVFRMCKYECVMDYLFPATEIV